MDEKEEVLKIIDMYIHRLEYIKKNIDRELQSKYFRLSCVGSSLERSSSYLFNKYHRKKLDDDEYQIILQ
jgi:hypothetical protein